MQKELSLFLDDDDGKEHFNMSKIAKNYKQSLKKKQKKKRHDDVSRFSFVCLFVVAVVVIVVVAAAGAQGF